MDLQRAERAESGGDGAPVPSAVPAAGSALQTVRQELAAYADALPACPACRVLLAACLNLAEHASPYPASVVAAFERCLGRMAACADGGHVQDGPLARLQAQREGGRLLALVDHLDELRQRNRGIAGPRDVG